MLRIPTNIVSVTINTERSGIKQHNCVSWRPLWVRSPAHCGAHATSVLAPGLAGLKSRCRRGTSSSGVLTGGRSASKLLWPFPGGRLMGAPPLLLTIKWAIVGAWTLPAAPAHRPISSLSLQARREPSHTGVSSLRPHPFRGSSD